MLRGNPPPPPNIPFFSFYLFSFTFQKKSENFGGGFEPPEPPLKYALAHGCCYSVSDHHTTFLLYDRLQYVSDYPTESSI